MTFGPFSGSKNSGPLEWLWCGFYTAGDTKERVRSLDLETMLRGHVHACFTVDGWRLHYSTADHLRDAMSDSIVSLAAIDIVSSPENSGPGQHVHPSPDGAVYYIRLSSHYEVSARPKGRDFQTLNTKKKKKKKICHPRLFDRCRWDVLFRVLIIRNF